MKKPPILPCRVINSNCSVFCTECRSTMTRKPFWFGKRSCDNKECSSNKRGIDFSDTNELLDKLLKII